MTKKTTKRWGRPPVTRRRVWLTICDMTAANESDTIQTTSAQLQEGCAAHGGKISDRGVRLALIALVDEGYITKSAVTGVGYTIRVLQGRASP